MSSDRVIEVEALGKCYSIYGKPSDRLKQALGRRIAAAFGKAPPRYGRDFWALDDVTFSVGRGETVAIIGRNGSGKSTLLQLIAGTLEPTRGRVLVAGRVAALLELGAGFNPEFTGIENVYLNGSLLGLTRQQIDERLPAILEFAAIGDFVHEPVKTYSSGMYMRLAFAVSVQVEPDVLIVDEALAVGDIAFQYKCFRRLDELKARGVTILMVTHAMGTVLEHADRAILLERGRLLRDDRDLLSVVADYERLLRGMARADAAADDRSSAGGAGRIPCRQELADFALSSREHALGEQRFGTHRAIIKQVVLAQSDFATADDPILIAGRRCVLRFSLLAAERIDNVALGVSARRADSGDLWGDNNVYAGVDIVLRPGTNEIVYEFQMPLAAGEYLLFCGLAAVGGAGREELDQRWPVKRFTVASSRQQVGVAFAPVKIRTTA